MKEAIKEKLPRWYKDISKDNNGTILTGDIDSLMSHYYLNKKFGCNVSGFFNFKEIYFTGKPKSLIGLDLDTVATSKTFGNHLTHFYKNEDAINLNNLYNLKYYQKYPLSTTVLILSLYDFDLESFTDEQLKILLAIDVGFKGYYTDNQFFKDVYLKWLDRLDIRFFEDRILSKNTREDMYNIIKKYDLHGTIAINKDGYLRTNINLEMISDIFNDTIELPQCKFNLHKQYQYKVINPNNQSIPDRDKIISMAWTSKNELKMTLK